MVNYATQVVTPFRKSSHSTLDEGDCVEVADLVAGDRLVRDSKLGACSPVLHVGAGQFGGLLAALKAGGLS